MKVLTGNGLIFSQWVGVIQNKIIIYGSYTCDQGQIPYIMLLLHVYMAMYVYMAGEGLWNSPPGTKFWKSMPAM